MSHRLVRIQIQGQGRTVHIIKAQNLEGQMVMIQLPKSVMDEILKQDKQLNAKLGLLELTNTLQVTLALLFLLIQTSCDTHRQGTSSSPCKLKRRIYNIC